TRGCNPTSSKFIHTWLRFGEIMRGSLSAQFPLKARAITVNGNASQGTIEALINVIYTWQ
ncbi:hypothetical protein ACSYT5_06375, partial [Escherichia coli]